MTKDEGGRMKGESRRRGAFSRRVLALVFLLHPSSFILTQTGCTIIGAVASKVAPEPKIPAQFVPAKVTTVVIVENFHNPAAMRMDADAVAREVVLQLKAHDVAPLVDPGALEDFRQRSGASYRGMALDAIARAMDAEQVIYVDLEFLDVLQAAGNDSPTGAAEARVRVVDVATGESVWPLDAAGGFPVTAKVDPQRTSPGSPETAVKRLLYDALGDRIAKLFYTWEGTSADGAAERFDG